MFLTDMRPGIPYKAKRLENGQGRDCVLVLGSGSHKNIIKSIDMDFDGKQVSNIAELYAPYYDITPLQASRYTTEPENVRSGHAYTAEAHIQGKFSVCIIVKRPDLDFATFIALDDLYVGTCSINNNQGLFDGIRVMEEA